MTLVFHVLPTFLKALDGSVILKAQVELGIHQCWDMLQPYSRVFEKQVFEGWVFLARWPKELEGTACALAKFFLPRRKNNQQMTVSKHLESWREQAKPEDRREDARGRKEELNDTCAFERKFQMSSTLLSSRATTA